ncbi:hypothetical protein POPTR_001G210400v4 [Populus trichocarpa]|uniref:Thaumatin-like protein n=1 Tax=Populus trichocarpa TaxID=3694 RepID=A0A2K2C178_POPTR|nr:pathogenesis-related thaumatin-like protein 3.5 [Populus trichocarpa]PNT55778.2 hypothetical protein POPTR_001G210400v4 [Populus trichocarpa]|eukprot:XP_006369356.1 pathogenesis-related protein 5 [Populus trichocarpa]
MAQNPRVHDLLLLLVPLSVLVLMNITVAAGQNASTNAKPFTLVNNCKEMIWPGIITKGDSNRGEGFALKPGQTAIYNATVGWSGRIWARTGCNFDKTGTGTCQTGSCGTSLNCTGPSNPPNTIAEFTLGDDVDFYDLSLVDGYNLPIVISPINGKGNCSIAGCEGDLRQNCSSELAVKSNGKVIACRSACNAFNTDEYCCRGAFADPAACQPSNYSRSFKQVCPAASSYAFDDRASIITCSASEYIIIFCASRNQSVCSYHDKKLVCNTSTGSTAPPLDLGGWIRMLSLSMLFILKMKF